MAGQVSSPALAAAMGKALAAAGLSSSSVSDAVSDAVRAFADRVGLAGVAVSCSPVSHRVVVVSAPPAAAQWLRLDLPGLAAAVRAVPGVDAATVVRVRRDDVT